MQQTRWLKLHSILIQDSILNLFCQQSTPDVSTVEPLEL